MSTEEWVDAFRSMRPTQGDVEMYRLEEIALDLLDDLTLVERVYRSGKAPKHGS